MSGPASARSRATALCATPSQPSPFSLRTSGSRNTARTRLTPGLNTGLRAEASAFAARMSRWRSWTKAGVSRQEAISCSIEVGARSGGPR